MNEFLKEFSVKKKFVYQNDGNIEYSQEKIPNYTTFCFEGGGVKSLAYIGALQCIEDFNLHQYVKTFIGSSAGAMVSSLLAVGYSPQEVSKILYTKCLSDYKDKKITGFLGHLFDLSTKLGYFSGKKMEKTFEKYFKKKTKLKYLTFDDLYKFNGNTLIISGTNLRKENIEYFSRFTTPHMRISLAIRITTAIPLLFQPVEYNGSIYADGGLLDNFPIAYIDKLYSKKKDEKKLLGFILEERKYQKFENPDSLFSLMRSIINSGFNRMESINKINDDSRIIKLDTMGVTSVNYMVKEKDLIKLVENSYLTVLKYIQKMNSEIDLEIDLNYVNYEFKKKNKLKELIKIIFT